jgi:hypothetical protein
MVDLVFSLSMCYCYGFFADAVYIVVALLWCANERKRSVVLHIIHFELNASSTASCGSCWPGTNAREMKDARRFCYKRIVFFCWTLK